VRRAHDSNTGERRRAHLLHGVSMLLPLALVACHPPTPEQRYQTWRSRHAAEVMAYQAYLARHGGDAIAMSDLLRSARRWRLCGAEEFVVPPESQWPAMLPTLQVIAQMQSLGLLTGSRVASVYRYEALNRCEGGSTRSRHRINNAIDLDLRGSADTVAKLCAYWRTQGPKQRIGLGFYTPAKIHIDTSGFRTWGRDFHRGTSACVSQR